MQDKFVGGIDLRLIGRRKTPSSIHLSEIRYSDGCLTIAGSLQRLMDCHGGSAAANDCQEESQKLPYFKTYSVDRKSTFRMAHFLDSSLISYGTRKQNSHSLSTIEVEYVSADSYYA
ncbi:hypothetical protein HAX54_005348 [Datura stramonium]|uniref:Uncharacterized protein n=1 Tax=Datura stramonium TaxID=4076 RepID=A0ABS8T9S8_DATST|nr:hypothetical protein [Datura stramonium]